MRRLSVSSSAHRDLLEIVESLGRDNPQAALNFVAKLDDRFTLLDKHPELGEIRSDLGPNRRMSILGSYVIYYDLLATQLSIVRILHGARDVGFLER
jgi:toxin ParE1/3/4